RLQPVITCPLTLRSTKVTPMCYFASKTAIIYQYLIQQHTFIQRSDFDSPFFFPFDREAYFADSLVSENIHFPLFTASLSFVRHHLKRFIIQGNTKPDIAS